MTSLTEVTQQTELIEQTVPVSEAVALFRILAFIPQTSVHVDTKKSLI